VAAADAEAALDGIYIIRCMLAYYVMWHMKRALAPVLFADADPAGATDDGTPLHSFRTLLRDLATLTRHRVRLGEAHFQQRTTPTAGQQRVFQLLDVRL